MRETPQEIAHAMHEAVQVLTIRNASSIERIVRDYSRRLRHRPPDVVVEVARILKEAYGYRSGISYELVRYREDALELMNRKIIERLGEGINSWGTVDSFARNVSGPAWVRGQITDDAIQDWARSEDRWWRRAALVSTVALNSKVSGGAGDAARTLAVCRILVADRDDMVVKALSWALRDLIGFNRDAVVSFLSEHEQVLAARVKREVRNKLETGLKTPRKRKR